MKDKIRDLIMLQHGTTPMSGEEIAKAFNELARQEGVTQMDVLGTYLDEYYSMIDKQKIEGASNGSSTMYLSK